MMDEQLSGKLTEILSGIQSATKAAGDFALEQLPDIAQSYVMYGRVKTAVLTTFLLLLATALASLSWWAYKNPWNTGYFAHKDEKRGESNYFVMLGGASVGILLAAVAFLSFDFLVWFAPKVWLLKELASLVK
jgi:hypothetical protein